MSGQSKMRSTLIAMFGSLLLSSVAVTAAVGPAHVGNERSETRIHA